MHKQTAVSINMILYENRTFLITGLKQLEKCL